MGKRGSEATFKTNSEKVKAKDVRLTLKDGESVKVVICTTEDYYQYPAHNDFNHGIFPQACHEENCPLCAVAALGDEFKALKVKDRYKFAFYVVDQDKIMAFDATAGQAKKLKSQLDEYAEDIEFGAVFTFKRTGNAKETDYSLSLISERKYTAKDKEAIEKYKGYHIPDEFFEDITEPVMKGYIYKTLEEKAGIDVTAMFPDAAEEMAKLKKEDEEDVRPTTPAGDDDTLPFNP